MEEHGGNEDLCASGRQSVIPYVHGRVCCIAVCVHCSSHELNLPRRALSGLRGVKRTCLVLASIRAFYSSRPDNYNETQGPTGGPRAGKTLCS
jgi:hypothetical protein